MTNQAREVVCQGRFAASLINNICAGREPSARCPVDFYASLWRIVISPIIPQDSPSCYAFCDANLVVLFIHLIATLARLLGPGGVPKTLTRPAWLEMASKVRLPEKFLWRMRKELHEKKENLLIDLAINDLIHRPQVIGKLGSLSYSGGHAE
ncbi:MAG: hypothetical protein DMG50_15020 [Acidobacteria bacterium]|nr:MAG: hypothetical protein DMG50_15020 [Acidobacteriota bacterium]